MKPNTWGRHHVPALPEAIWTEARGLVVIRLQLLKPDIPTDHWETMIREDDPVMIDSIIEVAVELATKAKIPIIWLRSMALIQENAMRLTFMQQLEARMKEFAKMADEIDAIMKAKPLVLA